MLRQFRGRHPMHPAAAEAPRMATMRTRPAATRTRRRRQVLWPLHSNALPLISEDDAVFVDALDDDLAVERLTLDELSPAEEDHAVPGVDGPHEHLELELVESIAELRADVGRRLGWRR